MTDNEDLFDESVSGYFGYCLSYEGATNAVRKYEMKTSTKYAVGHQEHPDFGKTDPLSRRHKVWFESRMDSKRKKEKIHFDGTPYISLNEKRLGCIYDKKSTGRSRGKKAGCPAMIILREIAAFPNYSISANTTTLKEKASKKLRGSMKTCQVPFQRRIYVEFPKLSDHCGHNIYSNLPALSFVENVGMYPDGLVETVFDESQQPDGLFEESQQPEGLFEEQQQPDSLFDESRVSTSEMHPKTKKQRIIKDLIVSKQEEQSPKLESCKASGMTHSVWDNSSNMASREPCSTRTLSSELMGQRLGDNNLDLDIFPSLKLESLNDDGLFELFVEEIPIKEELAQSSASPMITALSLMKSEPSDCKLSTSKQQNQSASEPCEEAENCDRNLSAHLMERLREGAALYDFPDWGSNALFEEPFSEDSHHLLF